MDSDASPNIRMSKGKREESDDPTNMVVTVVLPKSNRPPSPRRRRGAYERYRNASMSPKTRRLFRNPSCLSEVGRNPHRSSISWGRSLQYSHFFPWPSFTVSGELLAALVGTLLLVFIILFLVRMGFFLLFICFGVLRVTPWTWHGSSRCLSISVWLLVVELSVVCLDSWYQRYLSCVDFSIVYCRY